MDDINEIQCEHKKHSSVLVSREKTNPQNILYKIYSIQSLYTLKEQFSSDMLFVKI